MKDQPLDRVPVEKLAVGFQIDQPIGLGSSGWQIATGELVGGRVALIGARKKTLDEDSPFDSIDVKPGEIYLELALSFSARAGLKGPVGPAIFGFSAGKGFETRCYRRFTTGANGFAPFGSALTSTASCFVLPGTAEDLNQIDLDTVLVFAGQGELGVSAGFTISTPASTLASTGIGFGQRLELQEGGAFTTEAKLTLKGGYQVRLRRTSPRTLEAGIYTLKSRELALNVTAEIGVSATVGPFDLVEQLIGSLSRQPAVDIKEFRSALPGDDAAATRTRIEAFQSEIKDAICTKLQASLTAGFSDLSENEGVWIFEVDQQLTASSEGQKALTAALHGDLTHLTADPKNLPPGIHQQKNILVDTNLLKQKMRINLLGLLNLLSLTKIAQISKIEKNSDGDVTLIADTSEASRLEAVLLNAGWDAKRLRKMLSEEFLISATYQVSELHVLPPSFVSQQTHLDITGITSEKHIRAELSVARVLGLITPEEQNRRSSGSSFGRTTFFVSTKYSGTAVERLFFTDDGQPRPIEDFENAGRSALGALLSGEEDSALRLRFAQLGSGDALWKQMKQVGNIAEFGPLFGLPKGTLDGNVQAAGADFVTITSWAQAMNSAAEAILDVRRTLDGAPVAIDDPRFQTARQHLKERLEAVVKDTHDEFGDPLGLLMVYVASGETAERRVLMTGQQLEKLDRSSTVEVKTTAS